MCPHVSLEMAIVYLYSIVTIHNNFTIYNIVTIHNGEYEIILHIDNGKFLCSVAYFPGVLLSAYHLS